jgi:hypothetical protein
MTIPRAIPKMIVVILAAALSSGCVCTHLLSHLGTVRERYEDIHSIMVSEEGRIALSVDALYSKSKWGFREPDWELARRRRFLVTRDGTSVIPGASGPPWTRRNMEAGVEHIHVLRIPIYRFQAVDKHGRPAGYQVIPGEFYARDATAADLPAEFNEHAQTYKPGEPIPITSDEGKRCLIFHDERSQYDIRMRREWWWYPALPFAIVGDVVTFPVAFPARILAENMMEE